MDDSAQILSNDDGRKNLSTDSELSEYDRAQQIDLKSPAWAGLLTWILPGLGHLYQGRKAKAWLFFLCIVPTFIAGCILGSSPETGPARNVYYSWRQQDKRWYFIPQACLAMAAIPAGFQALQAQSGTPPIFGRFMAPPKIDDYDKTGVAPTLSDIINELNFFFELGTYLTVIAGLMNLMAIFDAIDGPMVYKPEKEDEEEG